MSDDRDLRSRFADLRGEDAAGAPAFGAVRSRRPEKRLPFALAAAGLAAVAVIALYLASGSRRSLSDDAALAQARALTGWTAPTDDFLELSGLEIPNSVPNLSLTSLALPELTTAATASGDSR